MGLQDPRPSQHDLHRTVHAAAGRRKVRHPLKESGGTRRWLSCQPWAPASSKWLHLTLTPTLPYSVPAALHRPRCSSTKTRRTSSRPKYERARTARPGRAVPWSGGGSCSESRSSWSGGDVWEEGAAQGIVEAARIKSAGGMAVAAHGIVDDSAFEVLMGGLRLARRATPLHHAGSGQPGHGGGADVGHGALMLAWL